MPENGEPPKRRRVWLDGFWREIAVWSRDQISPDRAIEGPAVIEEAYTTVLLAEHWTCRRDESGHLMAGRHA